MNQLEMFEPKEMAPDHLLAGSVEIVPPAKLRKARDALPPAKPGRGRGI